MPGQQFLDTFEVLLITTGRIELDLRLTLGRKAEHRHGRFVDTDRLRLVGQQDIESQRVLGRQFHWLGKQYYDAHKAVQSAICHKKPNDASGASLGYPAFCFVVFVVN